MRRTSRKMYSVITIIMIITEFGILGERLHKNEKYFPGKFIPRALRMEVSTLCFESFHLALFNTVN